MRSLTIAIVLGLTSIAHAQAMQINFTDTTANGNHAPNNIEAVWIEDSAGTFIKTIARWSAVRTQYLLDWNKAAGAGDTDAVSGATHGSYGALTAKWDLKDKAGALVPDATYTIRLEMADGNSANATQNHEGTFTFVKSAAPQMQVNLTSGGFTNVSIDFANSITCGNGIVEPGETCDPPGTCPTTCAATGDACMLNQLDGDASTCTAQCVVQTITGCANDDGCCPTGCTPATDDDCAAGAGSETGSGNGELTGGCTTTGTGTTLATIVLGLSLLRRKRR
jgi:uncharacterized protein (TIGR03382 family)